jgi:hypothetical protein
MASSLTPVFYKNDVEFPVGEVLNCTRTTKDLSFVDSEKDWKEARKRAASHGRRLCSTNEISKMY